MKNWLLQNGTFVINQKLEEGHLVIIDGLIQGFYLKEKKDHTKLVYDLNIDSNQVIDCTGALIGPGFIDIHVHGGGGADVMDASLESFQQMAYTHGQKGTTRFLLTTVTAPHEELISVCRMAKKWREQIEQKGEIPSGALPLGIHLEGPYISLNRKGAQNGEYIRPFSMDEFMEYQEASQHWIKIITLAPEKLTEMKVITELKMKGVVVSIGHTDATYEDVDEAFHHGAQHVTHLCNTMKGIHHRSPGPVTYALIHDGLTVEFIADGLHVHPAIIELALRSKKKDEIAIVTDAMRAAGVNDGIYKLGDLEVYVHEGKAMLKDGTLAGSCLDMERAYKLLEKELSINEVQLFQMLSTTPAKILGINHRFGSLDAGKVADLVIFRDDKLSHVMVDGSWIKGEL